MSIARISRIAAASAPMMRRAGDITLAAAPGVALVPLAPAAPTGTLSLGQNRPDASFLAHLIATAQLVPQTRLLRRAATADVQAAYRSAANQNEAAGRGTGVRMRLTA